MRIKIERKTILRATSSDSLRVYSNNHVPECALKSQVRGDISFSRARAIDVDDVADDRIRIKPFLGVGVSVGHGLIEDDISERLVSAELKIEKRFRLCLDAHLDTEAEDSEYANRLRNHDLDLRHSV